ncbi:MAG: PDZ domain-containing protein, partial [Acidobacteriota bacterium]
MDRRPNFTALLLLFGLAAFGLAGLSIADMLLPRPYDGVVLDKSASRQLQVREVIHGSGADRAGLEPGDLILGIGHEALRDEAHAARRLARHRIGERVIYLVKDAETGRVRDVTIELGRRRIGDGPYFYACALGFAFFFVGLFVLVRQPGLLASQVFYFMACLFLLFLVCHLRPASYSGIDSWILGIGTFAFLLLPSAFLHFYVLFPRPAWLEEAADAGRLRPVVWLFSRAWFLLYLVPPAVFLVAWLATGAYREARWFARAPGISWWLLGLSVLLGLSALRANARRMTRPREQRGVTLVLLGSIFGLLPFAVASLLLPTYAENRIFLYVGLLPLALVPITFTYAIVRFQLLDIRVILRRSLLYTVTTIFVTSLYAGGIATFNAVFAGSRLVASGYFPIVLALAIVVLFDPVRRRVQRWIDRLFFADRSRLLAAMSDLGEAVTARQDLRAVVGDLVERLPQILGFRFAALYLERGGRLERLAGPEALPERLPLLPELLRYLARRRGAVRLDQMGALPLRSPEVAELVEELGDFGVAAIADLA